MPDTTHLVVLVPGFFGFEKLANIPYFVRVDDTLAAAFRRRSMPVRIVQALVPPTASLQLRATALLQNIVEHSGGVGHIHLIGHSSGGLDLRVALSDETLPRPEQWASVVERVRTAVTIATPHYGTPLADVGVGFRAQILLRVLSWLTVRLLTHGRLPISTLVMLGRIMVHVDDLVGLRGTVLDQLYDQLLVLAPGRYFADLEVHLHEVSHQQGLVHDLRLDQAKRRNRVLRNRPKVRYGCVVTRAERPSWRSMVAIGRDPYAQWTHGVFRLLHHLAGATPKGFLPVAGAHDAREFWRTYGAAIDLTDNDGIVPTLSQFWGKMIAAVRADHFDVMGYFAGNQTSPSHLDLLATASGFDINEFETMWDQIADFCVQPPDNPVILPSEEPQSFALLDGVR